MIIREGIEVTSVTLDGYELPIPEGFSQFLLRSGYWVSGEVETINYDDVLSNYDSSVVLENGKLFTKFIYKGPSKKTV
ncbi:hypothetical protein [Bacillus toyonensis]|uniref:hypothetical protein n=1 Tax=Bacillus toyonensis TaxID=155322 RepID=UPI002FFDB1C7